MTRTSALLLGALLASCANPEKAGPTTGASVSSAPVGVASPEPRTSASAPPASEGAPVAVYSRFEGCLTEPDPEATKTRAMPKPDRVEVESDGGALRVAHHLNHPCCLEATTRVERAGKSVTLVEELRGTPCRCRCSSVVRSQLSLPAGEYDFRLRLEQPSGKTEAHHQLVTVSEASARPKLPPKIKVNLDAPKP